MVSDTSTPYLTMWSIANTATHSNQADLKLLEEMGITPDVTVREKRPSLKTAGLAVMACVRMQRMQQAWAGHQKVQESLLRKLDSMRKRQSRGITTK